MHDTLRHKVVWINDPFNPDDATKTDVYSAPDGQTIRQWLTAHDGFARLKQRPTVCVVDGQELCHGDYDRVIDQPVCFVALPLGGDGGSNPLALIASVALMVFAPYAAPMIAGAGASTTTLAVVQAGIMMAGGMMINALLPPAGMPGSATPSQGSPTYSISAQGNTARLRQPIPVSYGKSPCFPDFAAQPYSEFDGNEQYLNMLLSVGVGYHRISDIKLDLTPIENFSEAVYEVVNPFEKVTLFHTAVINAPEAGGQDLNKPITHGPYVINNIDQPITRVAFDVVFPGGLIGTNEDDGEEYSVGVHLALQVTPVDDNDTPSGSTITVFNGTVTDRTRTAIRRSFYADIPSGRYQATIQRTTGEAPRNEIKGCQLAGVRGFIADDNEYGDLTLLAVRVRASENNVSTKVNCVDQRLIPVWNSSTGWSEPVATRNPAWAFADAVRARYGGDFADTELNLPELEWLAGVFEERGDTFDGRFDTENNLWSALEQIGQVCRSRPIRHGLQLRMLRDQKQQGPVAVFSGANIRDFAVDYVMATEAGADSVLMTYLDETKNYQERTVLCQLPDATAEKPAEVTLFGAVNRDQVYREGMYLAKTNRSRRQMVSFTTGREGKVPKWGDLVHINHPRLGPGKKFAGLVVAENGQELTLSQAIDLTDHNSWLMVLRDSMGLPSTPLTFEQISDNRIRLLDPLPFVPEVHPNRERTHFMIAPGGEVVYPVKVLGIEPANEADVRVSGVLEDDTVHDDGGIAPPLPPDVGIPPAAPGLITDLRATQGGTLTQPVINLSWAPAPRSDKYLIEYSSDNRQTWQPAGTGVSLLHEHSFACDPGNITVRVAGLGAMKGEWVMLDLVAGGNFDTPGAVSVQLAEPFVGDALKISWPIEPAAARYQLEVWSGGELRRTAPLERNVTQYQYHYLDARLDGANRTLTVKIRAINGNQVPGPWTELTATNAPPPVPNNIQIFEYVDSFALTADAPAEIIKELRVYGSQTSGFTPDPTYLLASSNTTRVSVNQSGVWYFRACWVDNWGEDNLQFSGEMKATSSSVDFDEIFPIDETKIADDAISTPKLQANVVTAEKINAKAVTAVKMDVKQLSAISANLGDCTAGTFRTDSAVGDRVEMTSEGNYPLWIGSGEKTRNNGKLFYDKTTHELVFSGELELRSQETGGRMEMTNSYIRVYDENNVLRVEIGELM